jgi:GTP-binding protein HflX
MIEVWNKADRLPEDLREMRRSQAARRKDTVLISALTGEGLTRLLAMIEDHIAAGLGVFSVAVDAADGKGQAWLHESGEILDRKIGGDGTVYFKVRLAADKAQMAAKRFGSRIEPASEQALAAE